MGVNQTARIDGFTITGGLARGQFFWETVGGGMLVRLGAPTIVRCTFVGNGASHEGGGLYLNGLTADSQVANCSFVNNYAAAGGGIGIDHAGPRLVNCVFIDNSAETGDGGAILATDSNASIFHCTMALNRAGVFAPGVGGATAGLSLIFNSVSWDNAPDEIVGASVVGYSIVAGGHGGVGNLDADPRFVSTASGDLRLRHDSPAIGHASSSLLPDDATDLDGDFDIAEPVPIDRVQAGRVIGFFADVGAFEFCRYDLDGDGVAAVTDLLLVLGNWGAAADGPPDVDGDGFVGVLDFLGIIGHWGGCG
jgi:predicted outer membrane repeat protein